MLRVLCIFGTRPNPIKMAPVVRELSKYPDRIEPAVCVTAQHREMLASVDWARELIGYEPHTSFEVGLECTVQRFRDNWDRITEAARFGPGVSSAVREMAAVTAKGRRQLG